MRTLELKIVPTTSAHVLELRDTLRADDIAEVTCFGIPIRKALWRTFKGAVWSRTALVDGRVAGIYGVGGSVLGNTGRPWLLTSTVCDAYPLTFALLYREEVKKMLEMFPVLENYVDAQYTKAVRLLKIIGFTLDDPKPFGPKNALFQRFSMTAEGG